MADNATTWKLIHSERVALANTLEGLSPEQWVVPSQCAGWSVQLAAAHVLAGAEQTGPRFMAGMMANGFRFNAMVGRDVSRLGALSPVELVERLRARTTTTNHPPAPVMAMLGEVVVHGEDIRRPLGLSAEPSAAATLACLDMFKGANFPVGAKKRISGLRLVATDADWDHGGGPEVQGPMLSLLMAMTGRASGLEGLSGEGAPVLRSRL
ncbi:MAG TPA: maleylpyruvate isomerase family mycothiol-dependent enzyme [Acidimicrobiales bacterium]|nr:maleylpyruvate isomerase family mycothiol-dependent enzyme [Acidimicrobiales bacterium]